MACADELARLLSGGTYPSVLVGGGRSTPLIRSHGKLHIEIILYMKTLLETTRPEIGRCPALFVLLQRLLSPLDPRNFPERIA